jgi:predicted RNA methylase
MQMQAREGAETDGLRKRKWLATLNEMDIAVQPVFTNPPWTVDFRHPLNDSEAQAIHVEELQKDIHKNGKERWRRGWQQGEKGEHLWELVASPSQAVRRPHSGRPKPESAIIT